jgi:hypothetical protein
VKALIEAFCFRFCFPPFFLEGASEMEGHAAKGKQIQVVQVERQDRRLAFTAPIVAATLMAVVVASPYLSSPGAEQTSLYGEGGRRVRIVQLPGGNVEMEYKSEQQHLAQQQQQQRMAFSHYGPYAGGNLGTYRGRSSGYAPDSVAMRQAYKFAEENRPSVTRAFDRRSYGVEQAHLRGRYARRGVDGAVSRGSALWKPPASDYKSMQAELAAIHKDQQKEALAGQAEEAQLVSMTDPTILSNELMQQGAGVIINEAKAERAHTTAAMMKAKAAVALRAKRSAELKATAVHEVESSVLKGKSNAQLEAPARMMSLSEVTSAAARMMAQSAAARPKDANAESGKIQASIPPVPSGGDGCAGGVLCAIPTNDVAIQALEARLQADEIAISTLTRDVSELTKQTEELQKPLPLPAGAKPA